MMDPVSLTALTIVGLSLIFFVVFYRSQQRIFPLHATVVDRFIVALSWAALVVALGCLAISIVGDEACIVDGDALTLLSFGKSIPVILLLMPLFAVRWFQGQRYPMWPLSAVVASASCLLLAGLYLRYANIAWDTATPEMRTVIVKSLPIPRGHDRGARYLVLESWKSAGETVTLRVASARARALRVGESVQLQSFPGYYQLEWVKLQ